MSADTGESDPWLSNGTYPAPGGRTPETAEQEYPPERPSYPTPAERVADLFEAYPDRMMTPVSTQHGRKLRESVLDDPVTELREVDLGSGETALVEDTVSRSALPLMAAVWDLLEAYEKYRDLHLRLKKQVSYEDQDEFLIKLDNSYSPTYQSGTYAKLTALKRQLIGGEYPDGSACAGESCAGAFDEPVTVLFSLTASVYKTPSRRQSGFRPPADHDREIREAWTGSTNSVKRVLRDVLERKLGLSSSDYAWWYQSEPHPGDGPAAGYSHSHPVVILDAAAASVPVEDIGPEMFRSVVAKHVSLCDHATWDAHDLDDSVTVRHPDEISDFGSYVSKYLALGPEKDLLERSDEYLMWAASQWATTSQKYSKSRTATAAIKADRCHQQFVDDEAEQPIDHADRIVQSSKPGISYECACCGSHFGISQETESLTRARLDAKDRRSTDDETDDNPPQSLADRWPSATGAARIGSPTRERECHHPPDSNQCPLCARERGAVPAGTPIPETAKAPPAAVEMDSFERDPQWEPDAVVRTWGDGDETSIGSPGGTVYGEIVVEGHDSIRSRCGLDRLPPSRRFEGPEPWKNDIPFSESDVREGRCPPPELVERERQELGVGTSTGLGAIRSVRVACPVCECEMNVHPAAEMVTCPECDDREFNLSGNTVHGSVTAKQWSTDWYADRYERDTSQSPDFSECQRARVREFVRTTGITSVPSICGSLNIDPSHAEAVESCL